MKLRPVTIILLAAALAGLVVTAQARVWRQTTERFESARSVLAITALHAQEMMELTSTRQQISRGQRPTADVIALVNSVLAEAGIPNRHLKGLTPESDGILPTSSGISTQALGKQTLRLTLQQLTLPDLGAFLAQWNASGNLWTPTHIELTHRRGGSAPTDQDQYDITLRISAIYLADA